MTTELRGKSAIVGTGHAGFGEAHGLTAYDVMAQSALAALGDAGLKLSDVELVNVNFSLSPSILSGQVDAVIGAFRNFELNQMDIIGRPGIAFYPEEHGVPVYDELILVANSAKLDDPRLPRLLDALTEATTYLLNHPAASWAMFSKSGEGLDDALNIRAWRDTLPRFALRPAALDQARYRRFATFMKESGLIDTVPALETYAVDLGAPR